MPYVTSVERVARERGRAEGIQEGRQEGRREGEVAGLQEGIELALELKFGAEGLALMPLVRQVKKLDLLRSIRQTLRTAETLQGAIKLWWAAESPGRPVVGRRMDRVLVGVLLAWTAVAASGESKTLQKAPVPDATALEASQ